MTEASAEETILITGPTNKSTNEATTKKVIIGTKIERSAKGMCFLSQAPIGLAIQAATIIGKIV